MLISLFFVILFLFLLLTLLMGAPYVSTKPQMVATMIKLLRLKRGQTLYDLGSGDCRLLTAAAKLGIKGVGLEINPYVLVWGWLHILFFHEHKNIRLLWRNYWRVNLHQADGIVVYGLPSMMKKLGRKLKQELKKGTPVVSNSFQIPELTLVKKVQIGKDRVYFYRR